MKICDHTSVGMVVWQNGEILLIEKRKGPPFGFAPPAGHVDGDKSYEESAKRELEEEVGLKVKNIKLLIEGRKNNYCRREGGDWHYWKIYEIEADGEIKRSEDETKQARFFSKDDLILFSKRTEHFIHAEIKPEDWDKSPGLELIWYDWFKELKII